MWVKIFLEEIGFLSLESMKLRCDIQSIVHIATYHVFQERTNHIEVHYYVVRENEKDGLVESLSVMLQNQLADLFIYSLI